MKIALDAMSGDFAPISTVKGAVEALNEIENLEIILVGKENVIKEELKKYKYDTKRMEIKNANEIIEMTDDPVKAVREKKDECLYRFSKRQGGSSFCFLWKHRSIIGK